MEDPGPNARTAPDEEGNVKYMSAGGTLKIRYDAHPEGSSFVEFNPARCHVWFNGQEVKLLQKLTLTIDENFIPRVTLSIIPEEVDIDADTLVALTALVISPKPHSPDPVVTPPELVDTSDASA